MSRGLGRLQRSILVTLAGTEPAVVDWGTPHIRTMPGEVVETTLRKLVFGAQLKPYEHTNFLRALRGLISRGFCSTRSLTLRGSHYCLIQLTVAGLEQVNSLGTGDPSHSLTLSGLQQRDAALEQLRATEEALQAARRAEFVRCVSAIPTAVDLLICRLNRLGAGELAAVSDYCEARLGELHFRARARRWFRRIT